MWRRTSSAAAQVPARRPEEDVGRWLHSLGHARSHRLVAEDTTLSRWRHGFKSRWDYQETRRSGACSTITSRYAASFVPHLSRGRPAHVTSHHRLVSVSRRKRPPPPAPPLAVPDRPVPHGHACDQSPAYAKNGLTRACGLDGSMTITT